MLFFPTWKIIHKGTSPISGDFRIEKKDTVTRLVVEGYIQSVSANFPDIKNTVWGNIASLAKDEMPIAKNTLILGIAGGTVPALLIDKMSNLKITGVDYDPEVVGKSIKFLNHKLLKLHKSLKLTYADAFKYITKNKQKYDLIIADLYTGGKFDPRFEQSGFIKALACGVNPHGAVIINRIFISNIAKEIATFADKLKKSFGLVESKRVRTKFYETSYNILFVCHL